MPWPAYVLEAFDAIPGGVNGTTNESDLYGPYNSLLAFLFPATDHYMVSPQSRRPPEGWSIDFTTVFIVERAFHPVFFLEINPPGDYRNRSSRARADSQMRMQFYDLVDVVQLPVLHGLNALGSRFCLYSYNYANATLSPRRIPWDPDQMNDAPAGWWNVDLLSEEGVAMLTEVANENKRKEMSAPSCPMKRAPYSARPSRLTSGLSDDTILLFPFLTLTASASSSSVSFFST